MVTWGVRGISDVMENRNAKIWMKSMAVVSNAKEQGREQKDTPISSRVIREQG